MRCFALAEGLVEVGLTVVFIGDLGGVALVIRLLSQAGWPVYPRPSSDSALTSLLDRVGAAALVVDSYEVRPETYAQVRGTGRLVVGIVDSPPAASLAADLL